MQQTPQPVIDYIAAFLPDRKTRFVFPSGVTTLFWARETAKQTLQPIAQERFTAWDGFKASALSVRQGGKQEINHAIRTLFASNFLLENRKERFLGEYIPPQYADAYSSFIASLAKLLPGLDSIIQKQAADAAASSAASADTAKSAAAENVLAAQDAYFSDLRFIHERYARFLEDHLLYEPAWNRAAFDAADISWVLFFPELADDWEEYREELEALGAKNPDTLRIIHLDAISPPRTAKNPACLADFAGKYLRFRSSAAEFNYLARLCRRLIDEDGLCPEDIYISAAGSSSVDRLVHEFRLYGLFADARQGKPLPKHPGGRIFSALSACQSKRRSYSALSALLLDRAFPWKDREGINLLMEFGLRYHCVTGFPDSRDGREIDIDVWEKTFDQHLKQEFAGIPIYKIEGFYKKLKKDTLALINAKSFADIREKWHVFEDNHFEKSAMNPETNKIIGKALASLQELIDIGERFPEIYQKYAGRAFPVFQSYIQEETYVYESRERGIPVYAYKLAAGIAPAVHFVINMNQDDATVVYDGRSSFLREDRKNRLSIEDRDISGEFIKAYKVSAAFPVFTASTRTFSGAAVIHRKLEELLLGSVDEKNLPRLPDSYEAEAAFFKESAPEMPLSYPSPVQKAGWESLKTVQAQPVGIDLRTTAMTQNDLKAEMEKRICVPQQSKEAPDESEGGLSPSYLDEYLECPFKWVLLRGLQIREKQTEIQTLNQRDMGTLYHAVLERVWERIQTEDKKFYAVHLDVYKTYIAESIKEAIDRAQSREGYFQKPIYDMLVPRIRAAIEDYFEKDAEYLNEKSVVAAEKWLRKAYDDAPVLRGRADLVLQNDEGGYIVRDYKTKTMPAPGDLWADEESASPDDEAPFPKNVQMAAYAAMLETSSHDAVVDARFYSIDNREFRTVIDESDEHYPHLKYEREIASVDRVVGKITSAMRNGEYAAPLAIPRKICRECAVSSVCRKPYIGEK